MEDTMKSIIVCLFIGLAAFQMEADGKSKEKAQDKVKGNIFDFYLAQGAVSYMAYYKEPHVYLVITCVTNTNGAEKKVEFRADTVSVLEAIDQCQLHPSVQWEICDAVCDAREQRTNIYGNFLRKTN